MPSAKMSCVPPPTCADCACAGRSLLMGEGGPCSRRWRRRSQARVYREQPNRLVLEQSDEDDESELETVTLRPLSGSACSSCSAATRCRSP